MTEGFVKLYSSILDSSVWTMHDAETRIVWITMLAMADSSGVVHASVPGIAARAHVSIEKTKTALNIFQDVDEYSRSEDYDGRRVAKHGRDWIILNFDYFRKKQVEENILESKRNWWHKNKKDIEDALEAPRNELEPSSASASASASSSASLFSSGSSSGPRVKSKKVDYSESFNHFWNAYPKKKNKKQAYVAWRQATDKPENIVEIVELHKKSRDWLEDGGKYIPYPATWLNAGSWDDEITPQRPRPMPQNQQNRPYERLTAQEQAMERTRAALAEARAEVEAEEEAEHGLGNLASQQGHMGPQEVEVLFGSLPE